MTAHETVDYVDADDRPVTRGPRGGAAARGLYYRVAATVCTDSAGRLLVYRRPPWAAVYPDHHDILIGGCPRAGEAYADAAARELHEELGVLATPRLVLHQPRPSPAGRCWLAVHVAEIQAPPSVDAREIAEHFFAPPADLLDHPPTPFVPEGRRVLAQLMSRGIPLAPPDTRHLPPPTTRPT
ncbi:NUDIX domain-containing protein [Streptomyces sp. NPDC046385]|uniref:NUDIX domain-containing protein n=1 Tax=Streptomyces sp. NPDC046385 TaxID=3154918 RepID=UPI0033E35A31